MIIQKTYELIKERYGDRLNNISVEEVSIGIYLSAIKLSDGSLGTSSTFSSGYPFCSKEKRDFGPLSPSKIKGAKVTDILDNADENGVIASLKIASLNALSAGLITEGNYKIIENTDPLSFVGLEPVKTITIVGAFQSYIRKISATPNKLYVLEMNEDALGKEHRNVFVPSSGFKQILPFSDVVIITGQTLVNGTIDDLLAEIKEGTRVIVTGPSAGILPDILFKNGVSIVGAIRITNPDILFQIVSEGGTGFHLFEYCARKICIFRDDETKPE